MVQGRLLDNNKNKHIDYFLYKYMHSQTINYTSESIILFEVLL